MDRFYKRVNERIGGTAADRPQIDSGLEKYPDRRAWKKVSDIIKGVKELKLIDQKLIAGVVGVQASQKFYASAAALKTIGGREVLLESSFRAETIRIMLKHPYQRQPKVL